MNSVLRKTFPSLDSVPMFVKISQQGVKESWDRPLWEQVRWWMKVQIRYTCWHAAWGLGKYTCEGYGVWKYKIYRSWHADVQMPNCLQINTRTLTFFLCMCTHDISDVSTAVMQPSPPRARLCALFVLTTCNFDQVSWCISNKNTYVTKHVMCRMSLPSCCFQWRRFSCCSFFEILKPNCFFNVVARHLQIFDGFCSSKWCIRHGDSYGARSFHKVVHSIL